MSTSPSVPSPEAREGVEPIHILLVEDNPADIELTIEALRDARVANHLHVATDGEAALHHLRDAATGGGPRSPQLVLLDLNLSKMDGRELLAEIRADPDLRALPVVVLTTSQAEADILRSYELHANAYVVKPVDFRQFLDAVHARGILALRCAAADVRLKAMVHEQPTPTPRSDMTSRGSAAAEGASVVVSLPASRVDTFRDALPSSEPLRILLVEDSPSDARLVQAALTGRMPGLFEMVHAETLADGCRLAGVQRFSCVLTDLGLPDGEGVEVVRCLTAAYPSIPVVVLTGRDDDTVGIQMVKAGAEDYLAKRDATPELLRRSIEYAIERKAGRAEITAALERALEASRLKSDFLANMSHEIRTPMNGVIGMTELLLQTNLDDAQRDYAATIASSANALLHIINDILDLSKIEAGHLEFQVVDFEVRTVVEDVLEVLAPQAHEKCLEIGYVIDPMAPSRLRGDPARLRQVLINLIANGVKFTEHGHVLLRVGGGSEGVPGSPIRFAVSDTGIGICPSQRDRLFEPFWQADGSTTRRFGGTGLGLAICQELIHGMGGHIGVESEVGLGSTFWFTLPTQDAAPSLPETFDQVCTRRVLAVTDDGITGLVLEGLLDALAPRHAFASSVEGGVEALHAAARRLEPYDMLLIDDRLVTGGSQELAVAAAVRHDGGETTVVMLTSAAGPAGTAPLRENEHLKYLRRPVRYSHLRDCVQEVLRPSSTARRVPNPGPAPDCGRGRLLLADDNAINQKVAAAMLRRLGYDVDVAGDGAAAIAAVSDRRYVAVFMDCHMPVMDGYQATAEIRRAEGPGEHIPIIALTASAMPADREKCLAVGMDDHLAKPVTSQGLATVLARWAR